MAKHVVVGKAMGEHSVKGVAVGQRILALAMLVSHAQTGLQGWGTESP